VSLKSEDFDYICKLMHKHSGILLEKGKEYLAESRLLPLARTEGFASLQDLVARLRAQPFTALHQKVVEALTTNETSFFRDLHPFEALQKVVLPELIARRAAERQLNLWCAAASSGQEPYTIALVLREHFPELTNWTVQFIASDLSAAMLKRARAGRFSQLEVSRGLQAALLMKYFQRQGAEWQLNEDVRRMVDFRQLNLAAPWPALPPMDLIFMRNVLIYFDAETKKAILGQVRRVLRPGGYLFLGAAETTLNLQNVFERVQIGRAGCYRLLGR
jgi:chemotaxis protein methyltransferase CheR